MDNLDIGITAIGTATPAFRQSQAEVIEFMTETLQLSRAKTRYLKALYQATGIEYRYSVLEDFIKKQNDFKFFPNDPALAFPSTKQRMAVYKKEAPNLAIAAVNNCFNTINDINPAEITHLLTVSCTGMSAPGTDMNIIQHFQLCSNIHRTAINFMGCYGALTAIKMAHAICKGNPNAQVLVVSVELCSLHFQQADSLDALISNAIFADGAGALIIQAKPNANKYFKLIDFHCDIIPKTSQDMAWEIADQGFDIVLSSYVPQLIESGISEFTQKLLKNNKLNIQDVPYFAIHPGSKKILEACESSLKIFPKQNEFSYEVLKQHGNMSSATLIYILKLLFDSVNKTDHQSPIFSCAFGPGLTIESMLLNIHYV